MSKKLSLHTTKIFNISNLFFQEIADYQSFILHAKNYRKKRRCST